MEPVYWRPVGFANRGTVDDAWMEQHEESRSDHRKKSLEKSWSVKSDDVLVPQEHGHLHVYVSYTDMSIFRMEEQVK